MVSIAGHEDGTGSFEHTLLNEPESIPDVALVASKDETSVLNRLPLLSLLLRHLGSELDSTPDNTVLSDESAMILEVCARVRLPDVSGEGAAILRIDFAFEAEVIVPGGVFPKAGLIFERSHVDRCT